MSDKNTITATNVQEDVVKVIEALQKWHANGLARLEELHDLPVENDISIEVDGKRFDLTKKQRQGFLIGLLVASMIFEKFPITISKPTPIFLEGAEAWADCLELTDCPYPEGSPEAEQWKAGWTAEQEG